MSDGDPPCPQLSQNFYVLLTVYLAIGTQLPEIDHLMNSGEEQPG
jgi:hypothetical protein